MEGEQPKRHCTNLGDFSILVFYCHLIVIQFLPV